MTQDECIRQAISRIKVPGYPRIVLIDFADAALKSLTQRDQTIVDGKSTAEKFNPETFTSKTVEVQLHAPRLVRPYRYGPADVLWLEREIRRRAGL